MMVAYHGAAYHGWQIQPGVVTVQKVIQNALQKITGEHIFTLASGRTDTGVHALGQVINFHTQSHLPTAEIQKSLNRLLPPDIRILAARNVPPHFHSRYSVHSKQYRYIIFNHILSYGFSPVSVTICAYPLDLDLMRTAAQLLIGTHDFTAFGANPGYRVENPTKTLYSITITRDGHYIYFDVTGSGFLYKMVRTIVGTLIEVGIAKMPPQEVKKILKSKKRTAAGHTAPAQGLTLVKVNYPESAFSGFGENTKNQPEKTQKLP